MFNIISTMYIYTYAYIYMLDMDALYKVNMDFG